jgi:phosphatidylserine decarboxylase
MQVSPRAEISYHAVVEVTVVRGQNFPKMDLNGEADPFCVLSLGERKLYTTKTILKSRSPVWMETTRLLVPEVEKNYTLLFDVWDWDKASSNDYIGQAKVELTDMYVTKEFEGWFPVTLAKKGKTKPRGEIQLKYRVFFAEEVHREFWKGIYDYFDINGDGGITHLELAGLLEGVGAPMRDDQLHDLVEAFDENKDGEISFDELYGLVSGQRMAGLNPEVQGLVAKMLPKDRNLPWTTFATSTTGAGTGESLVSNWNTRLEIPSGEKGKRKPAEIMVHNRETGKLEEEKIPNYIKIAMRIMYTGSAKFAVDSKQVKKIMKSMTIKQGKKYNNPASIKDIEPFIEFHQLSRAEMLETIDAYTNFNEFFYRKLKPSARPVAAPSDPKIAVSPADCRMNVFPTIEEAQQIWIKGHNFNLTSLLQNADLAKHYTGGSLVIARLAPQDYHRFHMPVGGTLRPFTPVDGTYFTVNPVAVNTSIDVYTENKRVVCPVDSPEFGLVTFVAIGATMVGSICFTTSPGQTIVKGDEHGYFAFGGSTVLVLFPPGAIEFDQDLLINSAKPLETLVKVGVSIGRATK